MRKAILIGVLFFSALSLFAQKTIDYKIFVRKLGDADSVFVAQGSVLEGEFIKFPSYQLSDELTNYQSLYNVLKGSTLRFDVGALVEDVTLYLQMMSFDRDNEGFYFDHNLFFYMGVQVYGERTGFHDFDDVYPLQTDKYAYLSIPIDTDLHDVLNEINLDVEDIDFAYHTREGYNQVGISYRATSDSLICSLTHFSKFGGGRGSVLPVELQNFTAQAENGKVILTWETATEVNNYGFEILRNRESDSENNWEVIGFVRGAGNSNSIKRYEFTDDETETGKTFYKLKQYDLNGAIAVSEAIEVNVNPPSSFALYQNYPNPFNPTTIIQYSIPKLNGVETRYSTSLRVYNILGEEVATLVNKYQAPGNYEVNFDASDLPSGIYFYRIVVNGISNGERFIATKKMMLLK